jgi:hypothetical protein
MQPVPRTPLAAGKYYVHTAGLAFVRANSNATRAASYNSIVSPQLSPPGGRNARNSSPNCHPLIGRADLPGDVTSARCCAPRVTRGETKKGGEKTGSERMRLASRAIRDAIARAATRR